MPTDNLWNMLLTAGLGLIGAILRYAFGEIQRLQIMIIAKVSFFSISKGLRNE